MWPRRRKVGTRWTTAAIRRVLAHAAHTASTFAHVAFTGVVACGPGVATWARGRRSVPTWRSTPGRDQPDEARIAADVPGCERQPPSCDAAGDGS